MGGWCRQHRGVKNHVISSFIVVKNLQQQVDIVLRANHLKSVFALRVSGFVFYYSGNWVRAQSLTIMTDAGVDGAP